MTLTCATEYFVSYYGCPELRLSCGRGGCLKSFAGSGDQWLRYRSHIGNLTEKELDLFKRIIDIDAIAFPLESDNNLSFFSFESQGLEHFKQSGDIDPDDFLLQSVNDLSLDSLEERVEHVQARKDFERIITCTCTQTEIHFMWTLELIATQIRKLRYGVTHTPYFTDSEVARMFYTMEMEISNEAADLRRVALNKEKAALKLETVEPELSEWEAHFEAEEALIERELQEKLQELRKRQEMEFILIAPPVLPDAVEESVEQCIGAAEDIIEEAQLEDTFMEVPKLEPPPVDSPKEKTPKKTDATNDTSSKQRKNYDSLSNEGKKAMIQNAAIYACKKENSHMNIRDIEVLFGLPEKSLNRDPYKSIIERGRTSERQERGEVRKRV